MRVFAVLAAVAVLGGSWGQLQPQGGWDPEFNGNQGGQGQLDPYGNQGDQGQLDPYGAAPAQQSGPYYQGQPGPNVGQQTNGQDTPTLDTFGSALAFGEGAGGFTTGTAQIQLQEQKKHEGQEQNSKASRAFDKKSDGAARKDEQVRQGDLQEQAFAKHEQQAQASGSSKNRKYDQKLDQASAGSQHQTDVTDKNQVSLDNVGRYDKQDKAKNQGDKSLAARKEAYARQNQGKEVIGYGFNKEFDTNFKERGGYKEAVGTDNTNSDVTVIKQKDNRLSNGLLNAFRRSKDDSFFKKLDNRNAFDAQNQFLDNRFGNADKVKQAAEKKNFDYNSVLDKKNDVFWHRDNAQDKAVRTANDLASKRAQNNKQASANAAGGKGITDNKYYGGSNVNTGAGVAGPAGVVVAGAQGAQGGIAYAPGAQGAGYATGPVVGGGLVAGANVQGAGVGGPQVKAKKEGKGGDYLNAYHENAKQSDVSNQQKSSSALSDAKALNNYNRGTGVDDSVEVKGQREGKWAKDQAGLRNASHQGFNGAKANAAKKAAINANNAEISSSNSELDAANKNLQAQELDRVNFKRNEVDSNQRIRKNKKFYHDKDEDGFNNEALNFNRNRGNQDWGEEQQAKKEARTRYQNAADDAKVNTFRRAFSDLDARKTSDADATAFKKDNSGGWSNEDESKKGNKLRNKNNFSNGRMSSDFDSYNNQLQNRNQELWDRARNDLGARRYGNNRGRQVGASFAFQPDGQRNNLGLGYQQRAAAPTRGNFYNRQPAFGGRNADSSFKSSLGGFMSPMGGSDFGSVGFRGQRNDQQPQAYGAGRPQQQAFGQRYF